MSYNILDVCPNCQDNSTKFRTKATDIKCFVCGRYHGQQESPAPRTILSTPLRHGDVEPTPSARKTISGGIETPEIARAREAITAEKRGQVKAKAADRNTWEDIQRSMRSFSIADSHPTFEDGQR